MVTIRDSVPPDIVQSLGKQTMWKFLQLWQYNLDAYDDLNQPDDFRQSIHSSHSHHRPLRRCLLLPPPPLPPLRHLARS